MRLDLVLETGGKSGLASHISAGLGGGGACIMKGTSSAPNKSSSETYALGLSLLRRRMEELKGWQAVGALLKLGPRDASERLDDRLAIEIGLLEGVEPRLDEKDIMVESMSRCVVVLRFESKSSRLDCGRQAKGREV